VSAPASTVYFIYDEAGKLMGEYKPDGTTIREYIWIGDTLVALRSGYQGHNFQYVLTDHLNTPRAVVLPSSNAIIWRWDITTTAFGDHAPLNNPDGDTATYVFNMRYPGQYFDSETGLHYNYFRDYDPSTGRYVQSDPIGLAGGLSTYAYVESGPLGAFDPKGLASCTYVISIGTVVCQSDNLVRLPIEISVASGNNGNGMSCKNNPFCTHLPNRGPIPQGDWAWNSGWTGKPNGRVLVPLPGTETYGRDLFRTHSCLNAFGQSSTAPYCSEGCITGSASDMKILNQLLDSEPNSTLRVESFRDVPMPWAAPARPSPWAVKNYGGSP
jgi:RHS repeat-associated protein